MKLNYLKAVAIFMISLILVIPLYSSNTLALLSNAEIKGSDDINGYTRNVLIYEYYELIRY